MTPSKNNTNCRSIYFTTVSSIVLTITWCCACLGENMYHMYDNNIIFCQTLVVYKIDKFYLQYPVLTVLWLTTWCRTKYVWGISQNQSHMNQLEPVVKRRVPISLRLIPEKSSRYSRITMVCLNFVTVF